MRDVFAGRHKDLEDIVPQFSMVEEQVGCIALLNGAATCRSRGGAELTCPGAPAWLYACPGGERWAAVYHGPEGGPLRLAVPGGSVEIASLTAGIVVWDHGRVTVEANNLHGTPTVDGGEWIR